MTNRKERLNKESPAPDLDPKKPTTPADACRVWKLNSANSELLRAQAWEKTQHKQLTIVKSCTKKLMTLHDVEKLRNNKKVAIDVRVIMRPPFSNLDRINDNLYLTGIAGLMLENIIEKKITMVINCTYEMQLIDIKGIDTIRVPIDDDENEDVLSFVDDVSDIIQQVGLKRGRTIVHCMAGASRSCTFVIAHMIKYQNMTLRNAFCYVNSIRACVRPNLGFMKQLMLFETHLRGECSVRMMSVRHQELQQTAVVPDFYRELFPELYNMEIMKQLKKNKMSMSPSRSRKSDKNVSLIHNTNYINRNRNYNEIHEEIDVFRGRATTRIDSPMSTEKNFDVTSSAKMMEQIQTKRTKEK